MPKRSKGLLTSLLILSPSLYSEEERGQVCEKILRNFFVHNKQKQIELINQAGKPRLYMRAKRRVLRVERLGHLADRRLSAARTQHCYLELSGLQHRGLALLLARGILIRALQEISDF